VTCSKRIIHEKDVKMVMWEKTEMPESIMSKDKEGKTVFTKTEKVLEMTTYIFRDIVGEKLVILSKDNGFRTMEGKDVKITLDVVFNDFQKKNRVTLSKLELIK